MNPARAPLDAQFLLETERLRLRRYRPDDVEHLHGMFSDPEHMRYYPAPFAREETQAWVERQLDANESRGFALWIIEDRETGEFLGTAGPALLLVDGADEVEIGWHTRRDRWGEGIAPEAGEAARDWAFANLDVDHLIARPARESAVRAGRREDRHARGSRGRLQGDAAPGHRIDRAAQAPES